MKTEQKKKVIIPRSTTVHELGTARSFETKKDLSGDFIQKKCGYIYYRVGDYSYKVPQLEAAIV